MSGWFKHFSLYLALLGHYPANMDSLGPAVRR